MRVMIFGCGYSGQAIAAAFKAEGARVSGTARTAEKVAELEALGINGFVFDGSGFSAELLAELKETTHLVQSIPPTKVKSEPPPHPASAPLGHQPGTGRRPRPVLRTPEGEEERRRCGNSPSPLGEKVPEGRMRGLHPQHHRVIGVSSAMFNASTLTTGSPRKPNSRPSTALSTSARTAASSICLAFATRGTWK